MIRLQAVSKVYDNQVVALRDVNLEVQKGEFVFITGPSGAGKSTLLKLLYRETLPTRGHVWVDGVNVNRLRRSQVPYLRRKIGVVFQDFKLLPQKTVFDNVAFALVVTEASPKEIRRQVPAVLEMVGLGQKQNAYPNQLSGGEQQRLALARAVVNNPVLLLADEPTGNLDPATAWDITNLMLEINRRGTTVVMATHAEAIVNSLQRRVVSMHEGTVVQDQERGAYAVQV